MFKEVYLMQNLRARGNQRLANGRVNWLAATTVFLLTSGLAFAGLPAEDSENWSLRKETDHIRVYTTDQPGSSAPGSGSQHWGERR